MAYRIAYQQPDPAPRRRPKKEAGYLAFIHQLQCCVTGREGVEAAHVSFAKPWAGHYGRAKGTKAPDRFALPLHPEAHAAQHRMNEREWWEDLLYERGGWQGSEVPSMLPRFIVLAILRSLQAKEAGNG